MYDNLFVLSSATIWSEYIFNNNLQSLSKNKHITDLTKLAVILLRKIYFVPKIGNNAVIGINKLVKDEVMFCTKVTGPNAENDCNTLET